MKMKARTRAAFNACALFALTAAVSLAVLAVPARAQSADEQKVLDMQKKFQALTVALDADGVAALMADDAFFIHGNGAVQTKSEFVAALKSHQMAFSSYDLSEAKVVLFKGGAIVSGLVDIGFPVQAGATTPPRIIHMRGSSVWLDTPAGWKLKMDQDTTLAGPPVAPTPAKN
jgi:ketosteroid isomerase-like protein